MPDPVKVVEVVGGRLQVTEQRHINLIGHVYDRRSDRELLKDIAVRMGEVERGGA
jgi:hypothetical protein